MLNCTNSLEPQSMNSGIEHAALMVSEEKTQHDSLFGTTSFSLTVEGMGPYPLSDSTNLLGPTTSLAGGSTCYTNYGTNIHTPVPVRKCHYAYDAYDRDSFRRHSAHGRMSAASERCLEGGRNTLQGRSGASAPHHHRQQIPVCPNSGP